MVEPLRLRPALPLQSREPPVKRLRRASSPAGSALPAGLVADLARSFSTDYRLNPFATSARSICKRLLTAASLDEAAYSQTCRERVWLGRLAMGAKPIRNTDHKHCSLHGIDDLPRWPQTKPVLNRDACCHTALAAKPFQVTRP